MASLSLVEKNLLQWSTSRNQLKRTTRKYPGQIAFSLEDLAKLPNHVTPVETGVQSALGGLKTLDSPFRGNDVERLLQETPWLRKSF